MNKVLICLGMHRSGTSLIASWLHRCGLNMGDRLLEGNIHNQNGYFEDEDFLELHEEVLKLYDAAPGGLNKPVDIKLNEYYQKKFEYLVRFKNSLHEQWGWKEPRTCLFAQTYQQLLPEAKYIIIFRDYPCVVDSLFRLRSKELENWYYYSIGRYGRVRYYLNYRKEKRSIIARMTTDLEAWCRFNQRLLDLTASLPVSDYYFADYKNLKAHDTKLFDVLTKQWGFDLAYSPFNSVFDPALINEREPQFSFDVKLIQNAEAIKEKMLKLKFASGALNS